MANCKFTIGIDGIFKEFNSEEELNNYLRLKKRDLVNSLLTGQSILSEELDAQKSVVNILEQMSSSVLFNKEEHRLTTNAGKKITPVTRHMTDYRITDSTGSPKRLIMEFKLSEWESDFREELERMRGNDGNARYDSEQIKKIIDEKKRSFETVTLLGTSFHEISEQFFQSKIETPNDIDSLFPDNSLTDYTKRKYIKVLTDLRESIYKKHGYDATILPEVKIYDNGDEESPIGGIVDLIVIDRKGTAHIYDFKTSSKDYQDWGRAKMQRINYQLAYYRQILRRNKINVGTLSYIPIRLKDIDYENNIIHEFELVSPRSLYLGESELIMRNINKFLPYDASLKLEDIESNKNIHEFLKESYNYSHKSVDIAKQSLDTEIERIKTSIASQNNKNYYVLRDLTIPQNQRGSYIYIPKTSDDDRLKGIVEDYLKRLEDYNKNLPSMIFSFIKSAKDDLTRGEEVNWDIFKDVSTKDKMSKLLSKYIYDPNWVPLQVDALLDLGVAAFQNTATNVVDFISLTGNKLRDAPELAKGQTILGNFLNDQKASAKGIYRKVSNGDIELLKVYSLIQNNEDSFKDLTIGSIYAINMQNRRVPENPHTQTIEVIDKWYKNLIEHIPANIEIKKKYWDIPKVNHLDSFLSVIDSIMDDELKFTSHDSGFVKGRMKALRELSADLSMSGKAEQDAKNQSKIKILAEISNSLLDTLGGNIQLGINSKDDSQKRTADLIQFANEAIYELSGETRSIEEDLKQFGDILGDNTMIQTPGNFRDNTMNLVHSRVQLAINNAVNSYNAEDKNRIRSMFAKLYAEESSVGQVKFVGDNIPIFTKMLKENEDGEKILEFKELNDPSLSPTQVEFIKDYMGLVNSIRAKYLKEKGDTEALADLEFGPMRLDIPLMKASSYSALKNKNIKEFMQDYGRDFLNPNNIWKDDQATKDKAAIQREMINPFLTSDLDLDARDERLKSEPLSALEFDLEAILNIYSLTRHKEQEYNKQLPIINSAKIMLMFDQYYGFADAEHRVNSITNYVATVLYGKNTLAGESEVLAIGAKAIKDISSKATLGFAPVSGITETLTGLWNNLNRVLTNRHEEHRYGMKEWISAGSIVLGELNKGKLSFDNVNFCDNLNEMFNISEMDIKQIASKVQTTSKAGVRHFMSEWLYWFNSFPTYMHRMTMFVAQMIKDGIIVTNNGKISSSSPIRLVNGRLVYDEAKDARFRLYLSNPNLEEPKQTKEWKESRARYLTIREELSKEPGGISNDKLARPYTNAERDSMKAYADLTHGYYDTENKTEFEKTAFGRIFMHFKSWATAKKNRWYTKTHLSERQGRFVLEYDAEGNPRYVWKGKVMEGIIQSMAAFSNEVVGKRGNILKAWKDLEDYQKQTIQWMAQDLLLYAILMMLGSMFFNDLKSDDSSAVEKMFLKGLANSAKDLYIYETVKSFTGNNNPLSSLSWMTKTLSDSWGFATGQNGAHQMFSNIGLFRTISSIIPESED